MALSGAQVTQHGVSGYSQVLYGDFSGKSAAPDVTSPTISSFTVATDGDSVSIVFDEAVTFGANGSAGWTLTPTNGGAVVTLSYTSGDTTDTLVYSTSRTITSNETLTYAYTQPGNGVEDSVGNDLASISATAVTNNSTVDNSPTDIAISGTTVLTTSGLNAVVGSLTTADDPGDTHTYTLVAGTGDTDNASFNISGANLRVNDPSGMSGAYSVRIQSDDGVSTPYAEAFTITVVEPGSGALYSFGTIINQFTVRL